MSVWNWVFTCKPLWVPNSGEYCQNIHPACFFEKQLFRRDICNFLNAILYKLMGKLGDAGASKSVGSRKFSTIKISPKSGNESFLALDFSTLTHLGYPDGQLYKLRTWFSCENGLICIYNNFLLPPWPLILKESEKLKSEI